MRNVVSRSEFNKFLQYNVAKEATKYPYTHYLCIEQPSYGCICLYPMLEYFLTRRKALLRKLLVCSFNPYNFLAILDHQERRFSPVCCFLVYLNVRNCVAVTVRCIQTASSYLCLKVKTICLLCNGYF